MSKRATPEAASAPAEPASTSIKLTPAKASPVNFLCAYCTMYHPTTECANVPCVDCRRTVCTKYHEKVAKQCRDCNQFICSCCVPSRLNELLEPIWEAHRGECEEENCSEACEQDCLAQLTADEIKDNLLCQLCEEKAEEKAEEKEDAEEKEEESDEEEVSIIEITSPAEQKRIGGRPCVSCGSKATHISRAHYGPVCGFCA